MKIKGKKIFRIIWFSFVGIFFVPEVRENQQKLPKNSTLKMIEGGNHSQFGYLGKLFTDEEARIDRDEQQKLTEDMLISYFNEVENQ